MVARYARNPVRYVALLGVVSLLVLPGAASAATFTFASAGPITLQGLAGLSGSSPYPSTITVAGMTETVTKVVVTLTGMTKPVAVKDLDFLLVSPLGDKMILLSDAGSGSADNVTFVFDDAAPAPMAANAFPVVSGTFQPTNWPASVSPCSGGSPVYNEPDPDVFTAPAPAGPYGSTLSIFNGDDPNGTWSLYAVIDCLGSGPGTLTSWSITFTTSPTAARITSFSAAPAKHGVTARWRTASEVDVLGFNLYRATATGPLRKVNRALIAARGGATGASYRVVDRSARKGVRYTYRLQAVELDGTRTWYGSARVRATP